MSKVAKGNYYARRTREWLETLGYLVAPLERQQRIYLKDGRVVFAKNDIWGCDLMAKSEEKLVFIQVKANEGDVSKGMREIMDHAPWPGDVECWVVHWPKGRKLSAGPDITEVH